MSKSSAIKKAASTYADVSDDAHKVSQKFLDGVSEGHLTGSGKRERAVAFGGWATGNLQSAARADGYGSVLGMAGSHAIRGAAWGAVGGGTIEAMQGGSFWDGAKQGAFNGAVGWTGYRMGMKAVGATSMNPLKGNNQGLFSAAQTMMRATGGPDANVSKQAVAILNARQTDGLARSIMNGANKQGKNLKDML